MANIPTVKQLYDGIVSAIEASFGATLPTYGKNFLRAFAAVQAGKLKLFYLDIARVQKNIFADTADSEFYGGTLERFGRVKIGRNPFPATSGEYTVEIIGTIGAIIPASTTFKSNDDSASPSKLFILELAYTLTGAPEQISLRSLDAGIDSRLDVGNELTLTAPVALVNDVGVVISEDVIPQSAENIEDYRDKVLAAYRLEPQGGAGADYRIWSFDVQSVKDSYPYAKSGVNNEINLYVESTLVDSTDGKGTPTGATLLAVEAAIEDPTIDRPSRKPLGVFEVHYLAVTIKEIDIIITGFTGITAAIQTSIENAIRTSLAETRPFVGSIDILANKNDIFDVNKIIALILESNPGSVFGSVVLEVDTVAMSTYTFIDGEIPNLNSITYV